MNARKGIGAEVVVHRNVVVTVPIELGSHVDLPPPVSPRRSKLFRKLIAPVEVVAPIRAATAVERIRHVYGKCICYGCLSRGVSVHLESQFTVPGAYLRILGYLKTKIMTSA